MYNNQREDYRNSFRTTWQKYKQGKPLSPMEIRLKDVILDHPEYVQYLALEKAEFNLSENPFLHLGLHLAIRDQIAINRPLGIVDIYQQLLSKLASQHEAEHALMTCLTEVLWQCQQSGKAPSEEDYLNLLRTL